MGNTATIPPPPDGSAIVAQGAIPPPPDGSGIVAQSAQPKTAMQSVGDFASELWKQINPVAGIKGAAQMAAHPIDTFKNDADARQQVYDQAESAFKKGNYTEGAAHLLYSVLPLVGPQLNDAANNFIQGNYAKGAGASTGMGLAMAAPAVAGDVMNAVKSGASRAALLGRTPAEAYQSALKPSTTLSDAERASAVQTGLQNAIPVSKAGVEKIGDLIDNLNTAIKGKIDTGAAQGVTVNPFKAASRLSDTAQKFATQVNPEADLNAVSNAGEEFLRNNPNPIPADQAQAMKQGTYRVLGGKAYGEQGAATVEAQKALARGLKEELATQFPEIQNLNAQESKLLDLQPLLERAVNRIGNHQLMGIGTPITVGATKALTGSSTLSAVAGVMKAVLDDPAIKSRLAISLQRAGVPPAQVAARLSTLQSSLGLAAVGHQTASSDDNSTNQGVQ